jgi:hypothetical protein
LIFSENSVCSSFRRLPLNDYFQKKKGKKKAILKDRQQAKGNGIIGGDPLGRQPFMPDIFCDPTLNPGLILAALFTRFA